MCPADLAFSRLVVEDVEKCTVPFCCLFSKEDGTPDLMEEYTKALEKSDKNYVEKYSSMHHGWMGARAELDNADNLKEYERGYGLLPSIDTTSEALVTDADWQ